MNPQDVIDLAIAYTKEAAELKDYQVPTRKARNARKVAQNILNGKGYLETSYSEAQIIANHEKIDIEEYDPNEPSYFFIWALVPEYTSQNKAKVILRRVGTWDGEILLPYDKRNENGFKLSDREANIIRQRNRKALITKIRNYEAQIKEERRRLTDSVNNGDKISMKVSANELKRILRETMEDLDDFLNDENLQY